MDPVRFGPRGAFLDRTDAHRGAAVEGWTGHDEADGERSEENRERVAAVGHAGTMNPGRAALTRIGLETFGRW